LLPADEKAKFYTALFDSSTYNDKIYGIPFFNDCGLLYYREDLLEASGFSAPPETWDQLQEMALKVKTDKKIKYGHIWMGANYEGGSQLGYEFILTSGGHVIAPKNERARGVQIDLKTPEALRGLRIARALVTSGASPAAVSEFKEDQVRDAFLQGQTVFARSWSYLLGQVNVPDNKPVITKAQVGVAEVPVADKSIDRINDGGGWYVMINANSKNQGDAWKTASYLTGFDAGKVLSSPPLLNLPVRPDVTDDPDVVKANPVVALAKAALTHTVTPPVNAHYTDMSTKMAEFFNKSLTGTITPERALETLQTELQKIADAK
jgi:trehalose/maltose transport system substrate-binding protein